MGAITPGEALVPMVTELARHPAIAAAETSLGVGIGLIALLALIALASTVFWLWIVIEVAMKEPDDSGNQKIVWLLVILLVGPIGALIYFFVRRPQRISEHGV